MSSNQSPSERGRFVMDANEIKQGRWNVYYCVPCRGAIRAHAIEDRPAGHTTRSSTWGAGVATTVRHCTGCGAEDGPWVSAQDVGGGW